MGKMPIDSL